MGAKIAVQNVHYVVPSLHVVEVSKIYEFRVAVCAVPPAQSLRVTLLFTV